MLFYNNVHQRVIKTRLPLALHHILHHLQPLSDSEFARKERAIKVLHRRRRRIAPNLPRLVFTLDAQFLNHNVLHTILFFFWRRIKGAFPRDLVARFRVRACTLLTGDSENDLPDARLWELGNLR